MKPTLARLVCVLALACGADNVYQGHGHVVEVDRAEQQVVIEHEKIAGLMPAMTMSFDVADPGLLEHLAPGQAIDFDLQVEGKKFLIVGVRDAGGAAGARRSPILASVASVAQPAPSFTLTDQDGRKVSLADLRGRAVLVDFVYTTCNGPCPILTARQVEVQRALAPDVRERVHFVSISLDPVHDTPEVLGSYARDRGADLSGWSFLTGPEPEVADVVRRFGVGSLRAADGSIEHTVATFLVDGGGTIVQRWLGLQDKIADIEAAVASTARAARP